MSARYAWTIDRDHLADEGAEPGSWADNAATVSGPSGAPAELVSALSEGKGQRFRMFDDDGELYYSGRWIDAEGSTCTESRYQGCADGLPDEAFGPLSDFGTPNAGATLIKYRSTTGKWVTL